MSETAPQKSKMVAPPFRCHEGLGTFHSSVHYLPLENFPWHIHISNLRGTTLMSQLTSVIVIYILLDCLAAPLHSNPKITGSERHAPRVSAWVSIFECLRSSNLNFSALSYILNQLIFHNFFSGKTKISFLFMVSRPLHVNTHGSHLASAPMRGAGTRFLRKIISFGRLVCQ